MFDTLPRRRRNIICDAMLPYLPFIVRVFKSHNCWYILKLENMDEGGCYIDLYFYDKLSSLKSLDMSNQTIKHVWGTRFVTIRCETCMILCENLLPHSRFNPPNEPAKRPATTAWQALVGWKQTSDWWIVTFTTFPTHC
jgi:hypothetical protein